MWKNNKKYNELIWIAEKDEKLKQILLDEMDISIRLMVSLKKGDYVFVNGQKCNVHTEVKKGDEIKILLPKEESEYLPQDIELQIYYEDEDLLVVEKPYDMVVHPTRSHLYDTMLNAALFYFRKNGIESKVRFVNRLDRYTSGILIIAKNVYAHSVLTKENSLWDMEKEYWAIVQGRLTGKGTINKPIRKSDDGIRREIGEDGQHAITHYEVVASSDEASLVRVKLETGRTHQIRVHFQSEGHPLFGDELYGGNLDWIQRQALHAARLGFYSPRKEEKIDIKVQLPNDMRELIKKLLPNERINEIY